VTGTHMPALFGSLQLSHCPVQPLLQHTPSAQLPVVHSVPVAQVVPLAFFGWQTPVASQ